MLLPPNQTAIRPWWDPSDWCIFRSFINTDDYQQYNSVCMQSHIAQTAGGRLWGCNWGGTGLVYFWSLCCSGPGTNSWACASARASHDVYPCSNEPMQVLIIDIGADLQPECSTLCNKTPSVCLSVCVCADRQDGDSQPFYYCITFICLPQKLQTSITQEKTTESSTLSLCDWLRLLPKQTGLAKLSPLNHLWSRQGLRHMKSKEGNAFI